MDKSLCTIGMQLLLDLICVCVSVRSVCVSVRPVCVSVQCEGVGKDSIPGAIDFDVVDDMMQVTDKQSFTVSCTTMRSGVAPSHRFACMHTQNVSIIDNIHICVWDSCLGFHLSAEQSYSTHI